MEINDAMQARMALLKGTGYNVEAAKKCWDFVRGGDEAKKQEPASGRLEDGVYLIDTKGNAVRFEGEATESVNDTAYVGLVQGGHAVAIALHDVSEDEITLTAKESKKDHGGYKDDYMDAVQDWDGKGNTERLKQIGLNPAIQLKDGEYIPALAELYLICLNQKAINDAMRFVGGQELASWYWSSTESSAASAWGLSLYDGIACNSTWGAGKSKVRPVSAFLPITKY